MSTSSLAAQHPSLLSTQARIIVPYVKVTIGQYTFGAFIKKTLDAAKDNAGFYTPYKIQYPDLIVGLDVTKINGQVNTYSLSMQYTPTPEDDPNFVEKVLASVGKGGKIIFTYGDVSMPSYLFKEEEAVITNISRNFSGFSGGNIGLSISYTIKATSTCLSKVSSSITRLSDGTRRKPSDVIKELFRNPNTGLQSVFTGMTVNTLDKFIDGGDRPVVIESKENISVMDYLSYLVSLMLYDGSDTTVATNKDIYILTIHDETSYDRYFTDMPNLKGPYFKITRVSSLTADTQAYYELNLGSPDNATAILSASISENSGYSVYYKYQNELNPRGYITRVNKYGEEEQVYSPALTSSNNLNETRANDISWWSQVTQFPIKMNVTIVGLLKPVMLMSYLKVNIIFPGGQRFIDSGIYVITSQRDSIRSGNYTTSLELLRVSGDTSTDLVIK